MPHLWLHLSSFQLQSWTGKYAYNLLILNTLTWKCASNIFISTVIQANISMCHMAKLEFTCHVSDMIPQKKTKHNFFRFLWLNCENRLYVYACHYYYSGVQRLKLYSLNIATYYGSEAIRFWLDRPTTSLHFSFISLEFWIELWHSFQPWKFHVSVPIN